MFSALQGWLDEERKANGLITASMYQTGPESCTITSRFLSIECLSAYMKRISAAFAAQLGGIIKLPASIDVAGQAVYEVRGESDMTWEEPGFGDAPRPKVDSTHYNKRRFVRPNDSI